MNYDSPLLLPRRLEVFALTAIVIYRGGKGNVLDNGKKSSISEPESSTLSRQTSSAESPGYASFLFGTSGLTSFGFTHLHSKKLI